MIIGAAAGGIVLIALCVVGFLIWRRRRNNKDTSQVQVTARSSKVPVKPSKSKKAPTVIKQDLGGDDVES